MKREKSNTPRGSTRMKEIGKRQIQVWLYAEEFAAVEEAAARRSMKVTEFCRKAIGEATLDLLQGVN